MRGFLLGAGSLMVLMMLFPAISGAVETKEKVAVVTLDSSPGVEDAFQHVVGWLKNENLEVIDSATLQSRLAARQVLRANAQSTAKFEGLEAAVSKGTEDFYYKGNEAAIEALQPVFEQGLSHIDLIGQHPERAAAIFQAGLVLIRAYSGGGQADRATDIASQLAVYFPGMEPSLSQVPPDVVERWSAEVAKVAAHGTSVVFDRLDGLENCAVRMNGVEVGARAVVIQPDTNYLAWLDCGGEATSMWRVRVEAGKQVRIPLMDGDLLKVRAGDLDEKLARNADEFRLKAIAYWAGVDIALGIKGGMEGPTFARLERSGGSAIKWQVGDVGQEGGVMMAVERVMLEFFPAIAVARLERVEAERLQAVGEPVEWVTPTLIVSGLALGVVGGAFLFDASSEALVIGCSPNASKAKSAAECKGVKEVRFYNAQDYNEAWDAVNRSRVIGWSSVGVGAALVGWGTWRLLAGGDSADEAAGTDFMVWGGRESLGAAATWRF